MKYLYLAIIGCILGVMGLHLYEGSHFADVAHARRMIAQLDNAGHVGPMRYWQFSIDTYTQAIPSSTIRALYQAASRKLISQYGNAVAYSWEDEITYSRRGVVVRIKNIAGQVESHIVVEASNNNDNDCFSFMYLPGDWDTRYMRKLKEESSWDLPSNFLRKD